MLAASHPARVKKCDAPDLGAKKRLAISVAATRGPRGTMEDRYFVSNDQSFFAVYDGHGGYRVADLALANLYNFFVQAGKSPMESFKEAFDRLSAIVLSDSRLDLEGSTACVVHVGDTKYTSANVGDSRAILCRGSEAINLTTDQSKGFGFVGFTDPFEMLKALREKQGKLCGSRPMQIKQAKMEERDAKVVKQRKKEKEREERKLAKLAGSP